MGRHHKTNLMLQKFILSYSTLKMTPILFLEFCCKNMISSIMCPSPKYYTAKKTTTTINMTSICCAFILSYPSQSFQLIFSKLHFLLG